MIGSVEDSMENVILGDWEYSYSMGLFTTGWCLACCVGPLGCIFKDEDE